ncbi:LysR family transcriptional regulator [Starkeya sp. ORNL1]|uniref:LysR family transcriptional regulator n=1 Tax=Starkeya sp. ORNL1 TaxID=2709380 RepID=UPI001472CD05|nr:LysR family transcriptional regulator [Starkeya sp. ORNL1]
MSRSAPPLHDIATFVSVAQNASFTRAAEQLGTNKSNVGKAVQRLENRLGTRLFQRTTRAVRLTEDGETYLEAARAALEGLSEAEVALSARRDEPNGRVRIDAPIGFGRLLLPMLAALRTEYPKVLPELSLNDRQSDAVGEGFDVVVRAGELPPDSDMTVRKLYDIRLGLFAAPTYLARNPIHSVADLREAEGVVFRSGSGQLRPWTIHESGRTFQIAPKPSLITGDGRAYVEAAINGFGIAQIYDRVAEPHVASGELVHLLPDADVKGPPVHALIPVGRRMPPKTRVVIEALANLFRPPTRI